MSKVWGKTGFRPTFYDKLTFGVMKPTQELPLDVREYSGVEDDSVFLAKCHAIRAYRSAANVLVTEYRRDADYRNHHDSYDVVPGCFFKLTHPQLPFAEVPVHRDPAMLHDMIDGFSDYFPVVREISVINPANNCFHCICCDQEGEAKQWRTKLRSYDKDMYRDDFCQGGFSNGNIRDLMSHLHEQNTPVHSAAFVYIAYMSGDRLPDFGYNFMKHGMDSQCDNGASILCEKLEFLGYLKRKKDNSSDGST